METVKISNLEWSKRNLDVVVDDSWDYDNDPANREKYGRLYTWNAAMKAVAMLGDGWRLPTREDWNNLIKAAAKKKNTAGKNLKSTRGWDSGCWKDDNGNGTDDFDFSALPGGIRHIDGRFWQVGSNGFWWTTAAKYERLQQQEMKNAETFGPDADWQRRDREAREARAIRESNGGVGRVGT